MHFAFRRAAAFLAAAIVFSITFATASNSDERPQSVPEHLERQLAQICPPVYRPVCGWWRGRWRNFNNLCLAARAGARNIRRGRCGAATGGCPRVYRPVCGWYRGRWRNYNNACIARRSGARNLRNGRCGATGACPRVYRPVCARWRGRRVTFRNACQAQRRGAAILYRGQCRGGGGAGGPGRCWVANAKITVRIPGSCTGQSRRLNLPVRWMRHGQRIRRRIRSGPIADGAPPFGRCNFSTDIVYRCWRGRLSIVQIFECRQARSNPRSARCAVSQ